MKIVINNPKPSEIVGYTIYLFLGRFLLIELAILPELLL